ncbi:metallophosphoesterase [Providencia rettgeri]|nr:metallophosphoesterase [Providencia rettgeri]EIU9517126.1 metallophosphoesterase [Providencia rettgeri]ELR5095363.1 metallophosphoesterase [Providencia rettgeri]
MKNKFSVALFLSIIIPLSYADNLVEINILGTSDIHSFISDEDYFNNLKSEKYGLKSLVGAIEKFRHDNKNTYLVDVGDLLSGNPLGNHIIKRYNQNESYYRISPVICSLNALNYDVATPGNHDFDNGAEFLKWSYSGANFPVVLSNVIDNTSQKSLYPEYIIQEKEVLDDAGNKHLLKIAYLGLVPMQTMLFNKSKLESEITFTDMLDAANSTAIQAKKDGADLVIALSHSGIDVSQVEHGMENVAFYLAKNPNIDGILFGHTHEVFPSEKITANENINVKDGKMFGKPAAQPGKWGESLSAIKFVLEKNNDKWDIKSSKGYQVDRKNSVAKESTIEKISLCINDTEQDLKSDLDKEVSQDKFKINNNFNLIGNESLTTVLADSLRYYMRNFTSESDKVLISISPSYSLNDASFFVDIQDRKITNRDLNKIFYPASLSALKVNKQQLIEWLEMSSNIYNMPIDESTPLINTNAHSFLFYPIMGLTYDVNISKLPLYDLYGKKNEGATVGRISNIRYNNKEVVDTDSFIIVASKYAPYFQKHKDAPYLDIGNERNIDIFTGYISAHHEYPQPKNNYRIVSDIPLEMNLILPHNTDKSATFLWGTEYPLQVKSQDTKSVTYQIKIAQ